MKIAVTYLAKAISDQADIKNIFSILSKHNQKIFLITKEENS